MYTYMSVSGGTRMRWPAAEDTVERDDCDFEAVTLPDGTAYRKALIEREIAVDSGISLSRLACVVYSVYT